MRQMNSIETKKGNGMKNWVLCVLVAASVGSLVGCQSKGPMEEAGEKVDEAVKDTKRAVEDAVD